MRNYLFVLLLFLACRQKVNTLPNHYGQEDTTIFAEFADTARYSIKEDSALGEKIVAFAKTQLGVQYKYCSMDPKGGFDCSGFVSFVFNHFNIGVPRSSVDFTNVGEDVAPDLARPGDLILFTGTDPRKRVVGHIGIITANDSGHVSFIQSSSGAVYGVTISPLDEYYRSRFVKVIRILK